MDSAYLVKGIVLPNQSLFGCHLHPWKRLNRLLMQPHLRLFSKEQQWMDDSFCPLWGACNARTTSYQIGENPFLLMIEGGSIPTGWTSIQLQSNPLVAHSRCLYGWGGGRVRYERMFYHLQSNFNSQPLSQVEMNDQVKV